MPPKTPGRPRSRPPPPPRRPLVYRYLDLYNCGNYEAIFIYQGPGDKAKDKLSLLVNYVAHTRSGVLKKIHDETDYCLEPFEPPLYVFPWVDDRSDTWICTGNKCQKLVSPSPVYWIWDHSNNKSFYSPADALRVREEEREAEAEAEEAKRREREAEAEETKRQEAEETKRREREAEAKLMAPGWQ